MSDILEKTTALKMKLLKQKIEQEKLSKATNPHTAAPQFVSETVVSPQFSGLLEQQNQQLQSVLQQRKELERELQRKAQEEQQQELCAKLHAVSSALSEMNSRLHGKESGTHASSTTMEQMMIQNMQFQQLMMQQMMQGGSFGIKQDKEADTPKNAAENREAENKPTKSEIPSELLMSAEEIIEVNRRARDGDAAIMEEARAEITQEQQPPKPPEPAAQPKKEPNPDLNPDVNPVKSDPPKERKRSPPRISRPTLRGKKRFRAVGILVMCTVELFSILDRARSMNRDEIEARFIKSFQGFSDGTCSWLKRILRTPVQSVVLEEKLNLETNPNSGKRSLFSRGGLSKEEINSRVMKIKVRVQAILDPLVAATKDNVVAGAHPTKLPAALVQFMFDLTRERTIIPPSMLWENEQASLVFSKYGSTTQMIDSRVTLLHTNFFLVRNLILRVILQPWEYGIGPRRPPSKQVIENLKILAAVLYRIIHSQLAQPRPPDTMAEAEVLAMLPPKASTDFLFEQLSDWIIDQKKRIAEWQAAWLGHMAVLDPRYF